MTDRSEKVKAGVFVLVTVSLMVALLVLVAGLRVMKNTSTFHVRFSESITGLERSSTVRYSGVPIGRVLDIGLVEDGGLKIDVTIEVDPAVPLRPGVRAKLKPQGITGINYIDLAGGELGTALLPVGSTIPSDPSTFTDLLATIGELRQLLEKMNGVIEENQSSIAEAVKSIQAAAGSASESLEQLPEALKNATELTVELKEKLSVVLDSATSSLSAVEAWVTSPEIAAIPAKVTGVLDRADAVLVTAEKKVDSVDLQAVLDSLSGALNQLDATAEEITAAVTDVRGQVSRNSGTLLRILSDLRAFSTTMRELAQDVREQPSRLVFPRNRPERKEGE
jgi:phospholipid/cholesterol/gamma-HCH transport system substrate-binding protein